LERRHILVDQERGADIDARKFAAHKYDLHRLAKMDSLMAV
jgi:hypothetical protein